MDEKIYLSPLRIEFDLGIYSELKYEDFIERIYTILTNKLGCSSVEKSEDLEKTHFYYEYFALWIDREIFDIEVDDSDLDFYQREFGIEATYEITIHVLRKTSDKGMFLVIRFIEELLKENDADLILLGFDYEPLFKRTKLGLWANKYAQEHCQNEFNLTYPLNQFLDGS